jgi:hypothetical protein
MQKRRLRRLASKFKIAGPVEALPRRIDQAQAEIDAIIELRDNIPLLWKHILAALRTGRDCA